jgi:hypothetical protein
MNIVLWILQVLLAAVFVWHGWLMISPPAELAPIMNAQYATWFRLLIGVAELMAALGLILPGLTRILPWLTTWAAAGLMIVMASATVYHLTRGEVASAITGFVLFLIITFVAYMRWQVRPLPARQPA